MFIDFINYGIHFFNKNVFNSNEAELKQEQIKDIEAGKFKQKIKITMIGIFCKFYLRQNDVTYTYYINLAETKSFF